MPAWSHFNPVKIHAGSGSLSTLPTHVGNGALLLVTTQGFTRRGLTAKVLELIGPQRLTVYDQVTPNPELDDLEAITTQLRSKGITGIIALGGGSVLDAAKVLAVTLPSDLDNPLTLTLREGQPQRWQKKLHLIAIPTTSGTGAEVTPFATVWDQTTHKKHSVTGDLIYPDIALLDPNLTLTLPYEVTLYTGLDAISHALESLWNKNRTPISEAWAFQALSLANEALPRVLEQPEDADAREKMQQASVLAGLAISQTRTAIAHSISYPLTSHFGVPHGLACSFTLDEICSDYLEAKAVSQAEVVIVEKTAVLIKSLKLREKLENYLNSEELEKLAKTPLQQDRVSNFSILKPSILNYLLPKGMQ